MSSSPAYESQHHVAVATLIYNFPTYSHFDRALSFAKPFQNMCPARNTRNGGTLSQSVPSPVTPEEAAYSASAVFLS